MSNVNAEKRRQHLIDKLHEFGVLHADGRSLYHLSLVELENLHIETLNEFADAYLGRDVEREKCNKDN